MSGYAATAVLRDASIHAGRALQADRSWADGDVELVGALGDARDLTPPPLSLEDRIHYLREAWSQTTFYLFDPESWR